MTKFGKSILFLLKGHVDLLPIYFYSIPNIISSNFTFLGFIVPVILNRWMLLVVLHSIIGT